MKKVFSIGINDANYVVQKFAKVDSRQKRIWICPFYEVWYSMLRRCYSKNMHKIRPTYIGCSVIDEWLTFSSFRSWMETQDWQGNHLDKDLLIKGNKLYSPETCVFVSQRVNSFISNLKYSKGGYKAGVTYRKRDHYEGVYVASTTWDGKSIHIGHFQNEDSAHSAWLNKKHELACLLAKEQSNAVVAEALRNRYKEFVDE